jgi:hypothetical protein
MPPHPTLFLKREVYEKYGKFRLDMGSAADYELMLRMLFRNKIGVAYIPEVIVRMRAGGVSNLSLKNRWSANRKDRLAWTVNNERFTSFSVEAINRAILAYRYSTPTIQSVFDYSVVKWKYNGDI